MPLLHRHLPRFIHVPVAVLAAGAVVAAAGCSSSTATASAGPEKTHIVVAYVKATDEVPFQLAQRNGYFAQQGLTVTAIPINTSVAAIPNLLRGSIDMIAGANYVSFFDAQAKGTFSIKVVAPAGSCTTADFSVMTLPGSSITSPRDLAGKTISVPTTASVNTLTITAQLQAQGVNPASVHFVDIPFADALAALEAHRVDAISMIEPFETEAYAKGVQSVMALCTGPTAGLPLSGDIVTAGWAAKNPRTAAAFARAIAAGAAAAETSRTAEEQALKAMVKLSPPNLVSMVNFNTYPDTLNASSIQQVANLMYEDGLTKTRLNVAPLLFKASS